MFGLGFGEIIIILLIAMIVVGPEHLPELAKKVGKTVTDMRRIYENLRSELGPDFDEVEKHVRNLRSMDPRRELASVGRRVFDGLADDVPELANLNEASLRQQIIDLQAELRASATHSRAKTYNVVTGTAVAAAYTEPVEVVDHVAERRQTLERLGHQLLNDDVLDEPLRDDAAGSTHSV